MMLTRLATVAGGVLITVLWSLLLGGVSLSSLHIRPGTIGYIFIIFTLLPLLERPRAAKLEHLWLLMATLAVCDLPGMANRAQPLADRALELGLGCALVALLILPWALFSPLSGQQRQRRFPSWGMFSQGALGVLSLAMVAVFQLSNRQLRLAGVPNEDRSVFLWGVEMHHINWGIMMLVVVTLAWGRFAANKLGRVMGILALGLGLGFIWDEWIYYALEDVSDDAYFTLFTVATAVAGIIASHVLWVLSRPRGRPTHSDERLPISGK